MNTHLMGRSRGTLSVTETGAWLGLSRNTAYAMVHAGTIPSTRFGRQYRVPVAWVLRAGGFDPAADVEQAEVT